MGNVYGIDAGSGGAGFTESVANFSALPPAADHKDELFFVENSEGTRWLPGSLGGTYFPRGAYFSNGAEWIYQENPGQATQSEVNAGVVSDKFVTPLTLNAWTGSGTEVIILSNSAPTVNDDNTLGYFVGQRWVDENEDRSYLAQDVSTGAAVWKEITPVGGMSTGPNGETVFESGVSLGDAVTPPTLTANTNDWVVTDIEKAIVLRVSSDGNYSLTGLVPFDDTTAWMLFIANVGTNNISLKNNDAASSANNRFLIGGDKTIQSDEGILLFYDPVSNRWRGSGILI